jgi:hypothetical protein
MKGASMKRFLFITIVIVIVACVAYSQTRDQRIETAKTQIEMLLSAHKSGPYKELDEVIDIDSSIDVPGIANGKISNPYGTLSECYLFIATTEGTQGENQKHSIGVYRGSQIIWMSEQLPGSENYGYLTDEGFLTIKDLNRSGKVDIVVYFSDATNPPTGYYLWIFSWDGKQGKCINKCEKDGETSITSTGAFDIVDVDGDGIDEIRSYDQRAKVNALYYWNGKLYIEKSVISHPHR